MKQQREHTKDKDPGTDDAAKRANTEHTSDGRPRKCSTPRMKQKNNAHQESMTDEAAMISELHGSYIFCAA